MGAHGAMTYRLLGDLEVRDGEGVLVDVRPAKQRAVLVILLLRAGHVVATETLVDRLWAGSPPATAVATLHGYVAGLRRAIGAGVIVTRSPGYVITVPDGGLDAARFDGLLVSGRAALAAESWAEAAATLRSALDLWRGPALGDLAGEPFARAEAVRLEEARLAALDGWARAELAQGHHAAVAGELEAAVAAAPLREDLRARLMLALYRTGRQAEALRTFSVGRTLLAEEVGIDPGPELTALEAAILAQDPALAWTATTGPAATPAPTRTGTPVVAPALLGRDDELALLGTDLASALDGHGRVALIAGEPGIGKTRLAQEVARHAADRGATVVWGRCHEGRGAPALWPWSQVLDTLVERTDGDEVRRALGHRAADIGPFSPAVAALADGDAPLAPVDGESARFRAFDAATRFLGALAASRPLVIALDDLHWGDVASLELLGFLAPVVASHPILVLGTFRTVAPTVGGSLAEALASMARRPEARRVDLTGLDRAAVGDFLRRGAPDAAPTEAVVTTVYERTQGNPFFVGELARWMDGAPGARTGGVPSAVGDVIRERVGRLPEAVGGALGDASILGQRLEAGLMGAVLDVDAATLLNLLSPAVEAGLLTSDGMGRWRFSHGLVNETLEATLSPARRSRLHERAATALADRHGDAAGPHLVTLAHHLANAVPIVARGVAVDGALQASRWAQGHLAHEQAEDQLRTALALLEDEPAGTDRDGRELEVLDDLTRLLVMTVGYSAPGLDAACDRMRVLCGRIDPDHDLLVPALWRLTAMHTVRTQLDVAIDVGDQLLALAGTDGRDPGRLLAAHMALGATRTSRGDLRRARAHLDEALALCRDGHGAGLGEVVPESPEVWSWAMSAWNRWAVGDGDQAEVEVRAAIAAGLRHGPSSYPRVFAAWFSVLVSALRGEADLTIARADEGIALASASGFGMLVPFMQANRGWARAATGQVDEGLAEIEAGAAMVAGSGAGMLAHVFAAYRADALLRGGRPAAAADAARAGLAIAAACGERWYEPELERLLAAARSAQGRPDLARDALGRAVATAARHGSASLQRAAEADRAALDAT